MQANNKKYKCAYSGLVIILAILLATGCRKAVEVDPPISSVSGDAVFKSDATTMAAVTGIFDQMAAGNGKLAGGSAGISVVMGLAADEVTNYSTNPSYVLPYTNSFVSTSPFFWTELYKQIYVCNAVINGVAGSAVLSDAVRRQATGEAKFMRAFLYFYATNLFGRVALTTTTDYRINNVISRSSQDEVYAQVVNDLKDAISLLPAGFVTQAGSSTAERVRPNKFAAEALLARVYLYQKNWAGAADMADSVITNTANFQLLKDLNQVFLKNSKEAIWQFQSILPSFNTFDGYTFVILIRPAASSSSPVTISQTVLNAFEAGDKRRANWIGAYDAPAGNGLPATTYYYPGKYKVSTSNTITEYQMVLRLGEQYLIRAEARAQQGNTTGAKADLDSIRVRAGLQPSSAVGKDDLLTAIASERQVELFTEWGDRWFDMKRRGVLDATMKNITPLKGGVWTSNDQLLPLPQTERQINPNLGQNDGYN